MQARDHQHKRCTWMAAWLALLSVSFASGCTGGGDTVISGLGNSDNHIGTAAIWESLADELADFEGTPSVSNEDLKGIFDVIRRHALEGELEAALVLLKLAQEQHEPDE